MTIPKRVIAREWLIFLACFLFGGTPAAFWFGYYVPSEWLVEHGDQNLHSIFHQFCNGMFGIGQLDILSIWFVPYFTVTVMRSIFWATNALRSAEIRNK